MGMKIFRQIGNILPFFLILTCLLGLLIGGLFLDRWDYSIRGLVIAVPAFLSSIYMIIRSRSFLKMPEVLSRRVILHQIDAGYLLYLFWIAASFSIIFLLWNIERELYFATIIIMYMIVVAQIFSRRIMPNLIIIETVFLLANIIYGIMLTHPLYFHHTDVMGHIIWSDIILITGHSIPVDLTSSYASFPLFHILTAECTQLLNLPTHLSLFIVTCPLFVITVPFLYYIIKMISNNIQLSLFSCLLYSMSNITLSKGVNMVTSVVAFVVFVAIIYFLIKVKLTEKFRISGRILTLIASVFLILVHQVSVALIVGLIFLLATCELIAQKREYFSNIYPFLLISLFVSYWVYFAPEFIGFIINPRKNVDLLGLRNVVTSDIGISQFQEAINFIINNIFSSVFILFALIGIGYIFVKQRPKYLLVFGAFSLITLPLYLPNPLYAIEAFHSLRLDRFWILLAPIMSCIMAYGFIVVQSNHSQKKGTSSIITFFTTILLLIFVVSSVYPIVLTDLPNTTRLYFNSDELDGFDFIVDKVPHDSLLYSDYYTRRFFRFQYFSLTQEFNLPYYSNTILSDFDDLILNKGYFIIRTEEFFKYGLMFEESKDISYLYSNKQENKLAFFDKTQNTNKIYSNNALSVFIRETK